MGKTRIAEMIARRWAVHGRTVVTSTSTPDDAPPSPWRAVTNRVRVAAHEHLPGALR